MVGAALVARSFRSSAIAPPVWPSTAVDTGGAATSVARPFGCVDNVHLQQPRHQRLTVKRWLALEIEHDRLVPRHGGRSLHHAPAGRRLESSGSSPPRGSVFGAHCTWRTWDAGQVAQRRVDVDQLNDAPQRARALRVSRRRRGNGRGSHHERHCGGTYDARVVPVDLTFTPKASMREACREYMHGEHATSARKVHAEHAIEQSPRSTSLPRVSTSSSLPFPSTPYSPRERP